MASSGNRHRANCIGTLSFPVDWVGVQTAVRVAVLVRIGVWIRVKVRVRFLYRNSRRSIYGLGPGLVSHPHCDPERERERVYLPCT